MTEHLWILVVTMGIVTYIPRMLPMVFLRNMHLPPLLNSFLQFVPYATLGALIFPGILSSTGSVDSALVGGAAAFVLAINKLNLMVVVLGGILTVFLYGMVF